MEMTRAMALKLLKRENLDRAPAARPPRRSALTRLRQRSENSRRNARRPG
jgi:hypothetical protein